MTVEIVATATIVVRWKPSVGSRSLTGISALSALPARIGPAQSTTGLAAREPTSPFQSARVDICGVGYRPFNVETALYFCGCEAKLGNSQIRRF